MEKMLRKQASKPDLHGLSRGFIDGSGKRAMKLSDEAVPAFARVIGNDAQAIAKREGIPQARQHRRTPARREAPVPVYTRLLKTEGTRRFIPKAESLERLKRSQMAYFDSATAGQWAPRTGVSGSRSRRTSSNHALSRNSTHLVFDLAIASHSCDAEFQIPVRIAEVGLEVETMMSLGSMTRRANILGQKTMLIVDDHSPLRQVLHDFLQRAFPSCNFREAADGASALEACDAYPPNLVLMDKCLPDADGIELTARLKTLYPETQVIIVSSSSGEVYVQRALAAGARAYILKDHIVTDLIPAVAGAIGVGPAADMGAS